MKRYLVFLGLFVLMLINYIDRVNLSIAAPSIAHYFGLSAVQMGFLFSSFLWTYVIGLIPMGLAVDRWGARGVAGIALAIWSLAGMLTGAAPTFVVLLVSRLLLGIGECSTFPVGGRVVRDWAPRNERGIATAILNAGAYAGPAFGAVLVGGLVAMVGWRESFYVTGAIGLAFAILWALLYRRPEQAAWLSSSERGMIIREREDRSINPQAPTTTNRPKLGRLLKNRTIWALALTEACAAYTLYLFLSWMPSYLQVTTGVNIMKIGLFTAVPYAGSAVLVLALSWLSDRAVEKVSRRSVLAACLLCSSVILAAPLVSSVWAILALVSICLACVATAISLNLTLANDLLKDGSYAGLSVGFVIMGGNIFGLIAPIVTGYIVSHAPGAVGYSMAFAVAGVLLMLGAIICVTCTRQPINTEAKGTSTSPFSGSLEIK